MKKIIIRTVALISALWCGNYTAQNAGVVTETFHVAGNCGMCKKTIEKAAAIKGVKSAGWSPDSKVLTLRYDKSRTTASEVLRQVAYAGYDNEKYRAPDEAYENLHGCCQYDRGQKKERAASTAPAQQETDHSAHANPAQQAQSGIQQVYDAYFSTKDALVKSDPAAASGAAGQLLQAVAAVNMNALGKREHDAFMSAREVLQEEAKSISTGRNLEKQRKAFSSLSVAVYELMKSVKPAGEVYLDHCPMYNDGKGADWLSREKAIRNPYYGSKMMTCGNIKDTLR